MYPSNHQIFYRNRSFDTKANNCYLTEETVTNFHNFESLKLRSIKYKKYKFGDLNTLYGTAQHKLVDINLQGLCNYYIFSRQTYDMLCPLSFAQMAHFITKRTWTVGFIPFEDQTKPHVQISFVIDITPEITGLIKLANKKSISSKPSPVSNSNPSHNETPEDEKIDIDSKLAQIDGYGEIKLNISDINSAESNVFVDEGRYYVALYTQPDDEGIIDLFGTYTDKQEQSKIWKTSYASSLRYADYQQFNAVKKVEVFRFDKMYDKCFVSCDSVDSKKYGFYKISDERFEEKQLRLRKENIRMDTLGYLLIDYKPNGAQNHDQSQNRETVWTCGVLMYNDSTEKYIHHSDEMIGYIGLVKVKYYPNINNAAYFNQIESGESVIHLDVALERGNIAYFGSRTSVNQQKNMIRLLIHNFSGLNQVVVEQLQKLL